MEFKINKKPTTFTVSIGNIKMEYCANPILDYCPNWRSNILDDKHLKLDSYTNVEGVKDFFDGIINEKFHINKENCQTILELGELSGSQQIVELAQTFINVDQRSIPNLMEELVKNEQYSDQYLIESYLSKQYNEMLEYPEILKKIEIPIHFRIVKNALNHYEKKDFNYRGFISFVINMIENDSDKKFCSFLSLLELNDFDVNELEQLSRCKNFDENFIKCKVVNVISKIKEYDEKSAKQDEKILSLQHQIEEIQNQYKQFVDNISSQMNEFTVNQEISINEFKGEIKQQINDQKNSDIIIADQINLFNELKRQMNDQSINANKNFEDHKNVINELKKQINDHSSNTEKIIADQKNSLNEIKKQINDQSLNSEGKFANQINLINELKKQINDHSSNTERIIEDQKKSINEIKKQINDQSINSERTFMNQNNLISELKKQINDHSSNIEKTLSNQNNSINEIKQRTNDQSSKTERILENHQNLINELKKQINDKSLNTERILTNQNNSINELKNWINDQSSNTERSLSNQYNSINERINSLKTDLMKEIKQNKEQVNKYYGSMIFEKNYSYDPFSGIISALAKDHGGNANDKGVISISGNRNTNGTFSSLVDYNYSGYSYLSKDDKNSFICFDFKNHFVSLSAYSLKSSNHSNPDFLKSWIIEGSNGNDEWTELDSHMNEYGLCSKSAIKTYQIRNGKENTPFRYIRIKIAGRNSNNTSTIELTNIEFFGKYYAK